MLIINKKFWTKQPYLKLKKQKLDLLATALLNNKLIISPSDTVYGLVSIPNKITLEKIAYFKGRNLNKPISIFVKDLKHASLYAQMSNDIYNYINSKAPGKYTFILKATDFAKNTLPNPTIVTPKGTIGIRIIRCRILQDIFKFMLNKFSQTQQNHEYLRKLPVFTATSANLAGTKPFCSLKELLLNIPSKNLNYADIAINWGKIAGCNPKNPHASTIIDLSNGLEKIKIIKR